MTAQKTLTKIAALTGAACCLAGAVNKADALTIPMDLGTVYQNPNVDMASTIASVGLGDTGSNPGGFGTLTEGFVTTVVYALDANLQAQQTYNIGANTAEADTTFTAEQLFALAANSVLKVQLDMNNGTVNSLALYNTGGALLETAAIAADGLTASFEKTLAAGNYLLVSTASEYQGWGSHNTSLYASAANIPTNPDTTPVPEPGTMALVGLGLGGLALYGKRRQNTNTLG